MKKQKFKEENSDLKRYLMSEKLMKIGEENQTWKKCIIVK